MRKKFGFMCSTAIEVRIIAAAALVMTGCTTVGEPSPETLISHRGESKDAPENTMAAFRMAVDRGFGFECDIYLSKDKELFAFHDHTLERTTGGASTEPCIEASWSKTVSRLNVGGWGKWKGSKYDPSSPARLSEVLSLARDGRYIYVEIKGDNPTWVPYIKAEIDKARNVNPYNVLFITFGKRLAAELKRAMPDYSTYWLTSNRKQLPAEEIIAVLRELGVDGVDMAFNPKVVTADYVKKVKDAGFSFHVWTIDDLEMAKAAFAAGADTLTTNRAKDLLDEYRRSLGRW